MNLLIVDLEATCWDDREQSIETMEIIEFGCAVYDLDGHAVLGSYSQLVRPILNPQLSEFCTELTSITQTMINAAPPYPAAVDNLDEWTKRFDLVAWGSWGQFDYNQVEADKKKHGIAPLLFDLPHLNIKKLWQQTTGYGKRRAGLGGALKALGYEFEGTHHRGIDDACNIARILPHIDQALLMPENGPGLG